MGLSRFGSLDTFLEVGDWNYRMGRPVANEGFLRALITYGTFDTYEFFCPDLHHMDAFMAKVEELVPDARCRERVRASLQIALPESLRSTRYDVFHMGDFTYFMPRLVALRNRLCPKPFPVTGVTHSLDAVRMSIRYLELALSGLGPWDGIVCTSRAAMDVVQKGLRWAFDHAGKALMGEERGPSGPRMERIPLGIDGTPPEDGDRHRAREFLRIPEGTVVGLSVGRFSLRQKADWSPVLEQLARMSAAGRLEDFILLIAGGAETAEIDMLESLISRTGLSRKVLLFPNFAADLKPTLYHAADVYLSLVDNYQETFGLNIIEALASGLPVICSDFSGYRELVEPNETGWLIPSRAPECLPDFIRDGLGILDPSMARLYRSQTVALDLQALDRALETAVREAPLRRRMGEKARSEAAAYQWDAVIPRYESFWSRLSAAAEEEPQANIRHRADLLVGDRASFFSHYPSLLLDDHHVLELTDVGRDQVPGQIGFARFEDVAVCLFPELETLILETLEQKARTIAELKEIAAKRLDAAPGQTLFHIQWLMKHGALTEALLSRE